MARFRLVQVGLYLLCVLPLVVFAEDTRLTDLEGEPRSVSEFTGKGKWTVIMFWESSCGVCQAEAPRLEAFHQRNKDSGARVLGVSVDGRYGIADARDFVQENGLTFANLLGEAEDVVVFFNDETGAHMVGTPSFLVFDPQGQVRTYEIGVIDLALLEGLIKEQAGNSTVGGDKS